MGAVPVLDLAGEPYEVGYEHGRRAKALIEHNLDLYFRRFRDEVGLSRDEVLRRARVHLERIRTGFPGYAAMVGGLAAGSGLPLLPLMALNARYELFYGEFVRQGLGGSACTAFAVLPEHVQEGHLILGENWDWFLGVAGLWLRIRGEDLTVLCFTEAGIAGGKIGLNSAGVGLCVNGLVSHLDRWEREGVPFHVRCWQILNARTLDEAVAMVESDGCPGSANFLLGQAGRPGQGAAVDLERAPTGALRWEPQQGFLVHANHFLAPERLGLVQPLAEERYSTYLRQARLTELLGHAAAQGPIAAEILQDFLRDHLGFPDSVCRHPSPAFPDYAQYHTVLSVIIDLHARRLWHTAGPPCRSGYNEVALLEP